MAVWLALLLGCSAQIQAAVDPVGPSALALDWTVPDDLPSGLAADLAALEAGLDGLQGIVLRVDGIPRDLDTLVPLGPTGQARALVDRGSLAVELCLARCRTHRGPDLLTAVASRLDRDVAVAWAVPDRPDDALEASARVLYGLDAVAERDLGTARDPVAVADGSPLGAWIRGRRDLDVGRPFEAARAFDAVVEARGDVRSRLWSAHAWTVAGWPDTAWERVRVLQTPDPRVLGPLAVLSARQDRPLEAQRWLDRLPDGDPVTATVAGHLTPVPSASGPTDRALDALDDATVATATLHNRLIDAARTAQRCTPAHRRHLARLEPVHGRLNATLLGARASWSTSPDPASAPRMARLERRAESLSAERAAVRGRPCSD